MEHLIIRSASVNSTEIIRVASAGEFTQVRIKQNPFATDANGHPRDLKPGDPVWVAQSNYGVIGKVYLAEKPLTMFTVEGLERIEALRKAFPGLSATYWDTVRDRLAEARGKHQELKMAVIHYERGENFPLADQFRLVRKRGAQNSWMSFRSEADKAEAFAKRGTSVSSALLEEDAGGDYGLITDKIRWAVLQVWKDRCAGVRNGEGEPCEFDHHVPRALGGPGVLLENVIPLPRSLNRAKSHRAPVSFPRVAQRWGLLTDSEAASWGDVVSEGAVRANQERLTKRVTAAVRKLPVLDQRRFYFQVLEDGLGRHVRSYFEEAGVTIHG